MASDWIKNMREAVKITGPCSCHDDYNRRHLQAPDCAYHNFAIEIAEALYAAEGRGASAPKTDSVLSEIRPISEYQGH